MKKLLIISFIFLVTLINNSFAIGFDAEEIYNAVFVIGSGDALGSGFAIGKDCIITNAHVIDNEKNINVITYDGAYCKASVVAKDNKKDIAVLNVKDADFSYLTVADYENLPIGSDVYAIGIPSSMSYTLTKGVLSSKDRKFEGYKYLQTDAAINPGNSGGALGNSGGQLLNDNGEVIGVNTLKLINSEGIGLSIPMTVVCDFLRDNDIEVDEQGNIIGELTEVYSDGEVDVNTSLEVSSPELMRLRTENFILKIFLGIFIVAVVLLIILLIISGKKNKEKNSVRDFEIEIYNK